MLLGVKMSDTFKIILNIALFLTFLLLVRVEDEELQIFNFIIKSWVDGSRASSWLGQDSGPAYWVTIGIWVALELAFFVQAFLLVNKRLRRSPD